jgi:hypothetical protein
MTTSEQPRDLDLPPDLAPDPEKEAADDRRLEALTEKIDDAKQAADQVIDDPGEIPPQGAG